MFKFTSTFIVWSTYVINYQGVCEGAWAPYQMHGFAGAASRISIKENRWPKDTIPVPMITHHNDGQGFLALSENHPIQPVLLERVVIFRRLAGVPDAILGLGILALSILLMGICSCLPNAAQPKSGRQSPRTQDSSGRTSESGNSPREERDIQDKPWILIAIVASLPCLIDGIHFGLASGVLLRLDPHEKMHMAMRALIVGAFQLGQLVSTLIGPPIVDGIGRKRSLQIFAVGQLLAFCLMASWSESSWALICGRFMSGICFGQTIVPVYLSEIAPVLIRGSLVAWVEILTVFGQLLSMILHLVMEDYPLVAQYIFYALLALVACVGVSFLPRDAERDSSKEISSENESAGGLCPPSKGARLGLYIACVLGFLQQSGGEEALFGYCNQIAVKAGLTRPMLFSLALATMVFLSGLIASTVVDSVGRRVIIIGGLLCMSASWTSAAAMLIIGAGSLVILAFIVAYSFFSSLSLGPAYFVVASEVLSGEYRARGLATSLFVSRVTACIVVLTFELKNMLFTLQGTFLVYAATLLIGAAYMFFRLPETAGKSFDQIQHDLREKAGAED